MRPRRRRSPRPLRRRSRRSRKSLLLVFALVFGAVIAGRTRAACVEFSAPPAISTDVLFPVNVELADVDGDGDLDAVAAWLVGDEIAWLENTAGDGSAWTHHVVSTAGDGTRWVAAGDIDRDGDLDLASASSDDNTFSWHRNMNGAGTVWSTVELATNATFARIVELADLDGDGDLDLVGVASQANEILWYENESGDGASFTEHVVTTKAYSGSSIDARDVDGDGDLDVLYTNANNHFAGYMENGGDAASWTQRDISTFPVGPQAIAGADVDRDGDLDAFCGVRTDDAFVLYVNDGTPADGTWETRTIATGLDKAAHVAPLDVDGDGDVDLGAVAAGPGLVAWFENRDGEGGAWSAHTVTTALAGAFGIAAGDVDGDGDGDFATAAYGGYGAVAWYRNDRLHGKALFGAEVTISTAAGGARSVAAGDIDGDGSLDVLSAEFYDAEFVWHDNLAGDGSSWTAQNIASSAFGAFDVFPADIDGDGDLDALGSSISSNDVVWYENDGNGGTWTPLTVATNLDNPYSVAAADVDGDGDLDALSASFSDNKIAWHENTAVAGDGSTWTTHVVTTAAFGAYSVAAADIDDDGHVDLLSASSGDDTVAWYENDGTPDPTVWTAHVISSAVANAISVFPADVDGDGRVDVVYASFGDDEIAWFENLGGNPVLWSPHSISTNALYALAVFAADVDGDGDVDALSASYSDDKVAWYENLNGAGTSWTIHTLSTNADAARAVWAADVDGDGDLDALSASSNDNTIAWYPNLGTHLHDDGFDSDGATTACWSSSNPPVP